MTDHEVEKLARAAILRAQRGNPSEGGTIELKSQWTHKNDFRQAARQIGGLANAAGGQPVIWVIGVDEKTGNVKGADYAELSSWYNQIKKCFDDVHPKMVNNLQFEMDGKTVVALCFDSTEPPYVVNPGDKQVHREIPWRENNETRSAFRREMVSLFRPQVTLPTVEVREGLLYYGPLKEDPKRYVFAARINLYLETSGDRDLHAPHHRRKVTATFPGSAYPACTLDKWHPRISGQTNIRDDGSQFTITGPGTIILDCSGLARFTNSAPPDVDLEITMEFSEVRGRPLVTHVPFSTPRTGRESFEEIAGRMLHKQVYWDLRG